MASNFNGPYGLKMHDKLTLIKKSPHQQSLCAKQFLTKQDRHVSILPIKLGRFAIPAIAGLKINTGFTVCFRHYNNANGIQ